MIGILDINETFDEGLETLRFTYLYDVNSKKMRKEKVELVSTGNGDFEFTCFYIKNSSINTRQSLKIKRWLFCLQ